MRLWCISYCNWKFSNMCIITTRKLAFILKRYSYFKTKLFIRWLYFVDSKISFLRDVKKYEFDVLKTLWKNFYKKYDNNICEKFQWWQFWTNSSDSNRFWINNTTEKFYQRRILFPPVRRASNSFIISKIIALRRCIIRAYFALRISAAWLSLKMFHLLQSRTIYRENLTFGYKLQYYHEHMRGVSKIYGLRDKLITLTAFYRTRPQCQK